MSRPIPGKRRYVARSGAQVDAAAGPSRIALVPSRRAALLAMTWLGLVCLVLLLAVAVRWTSCIAFCIAIATPGAVGIRTCFLHRGHKAVNVLDWGSGWRAP